MGRADLYIAKLQQGETVSLRPQGHSMWPRITSGQLCTIEPVVAHSRPAVGDIVLGKVRRSVYLHLITAVQGGRFEIGNNHGRINGWVESDSIFGRLIRIED